MVITYYVRVISYRRINILSVNKHRRLAKKDSLAEINRVGVSEKSQSGVEPNYRIDTKKYDQSICNLFKHMRILIPLCITRKSK